MKTPDGARLRRAIPLLAFLASCPPSAAQVPAMLAGPTWVPSPLFTVGDIVGGYQPPGVLDGAGAFPRAGGGAWILVNHELGPGIGPPYQLANGTTLVGARISAFEVVRNAAGAFATLSARVAYDEVRDRAHAPVVVAAQINELGLATDGFSRFCSATAVSAGSFGFVDDAFFTGEETLSPTHPHGGSAWVLEPAARVFWAAPALGRGAWENVAAIEPGSAGRVALLLGQDVVGAPLFLYLGQKNGAGDGSFLDRNGLKVGTLYAWRADNGDVTPQQFHGQGAQRTGRFVALTARNPALAGQPGYDAAGWADDFTLRAEAVSLGAFQFSRPEDVATNPRDGTQAVFASTGYGPVFPADNWGDVVHVQVDWSQPPLILATLTIVHDADALPVPDLGIRSPDNLCFDADGFVWVQEDRATNPASAFGASGGGESSVWKLNPVTGTAWRALRIDRSVVLPAGSTDPASATPGAWESSGIFDAGAFFARRAGEPVLIATVQAHSISDGPIAAANLVQGGQLVALAGEPFGFGLRCASAQGGGGQLELSLRNGAPGGTYWLVLAFANAGHAPNGWFLGVDVTLAELLAETVPPFVGTLNADGEFALTIPIGGPCPLGLTADGVAIEASPAAIPVAFSAAMTVSF